jgi:hypothetical protein
MTLNLTTKLRIITIRYGRGDDRVDDAGEALLQVLAAQGQVAAPAVDAGARQPGLPEHAQVVRQRRHGQATAITGLAYDNTYCIVARIVDGQIREMTDYVDTELITRALFA